MIVKTPVLLLLVATPAVASPFELGVALGNHAFSDRGELGVADAMTEQGPATSGLLGARVARPFGRRLAVEGEAMMIPTDDDFGDRATVYGVRAHARFDLLTGRVRPFAVVGAGVHVIRASGLQMDDDTDRAYHWGGGARFTLTPKLEARLDVRHLVVPDRTLDGATSDYEVTAGMTFRFGTAKPAPRRIEYVPPEEPIVVEPSPPPPPKPAPAPVIEELAGIGFEHDSATIDLASAYLLERAHAMLERDPTLSIEIAGHTSAEGDLGRNLTLSLHRAEAVKRYLVGRGIAASRILTVGHGSAEPIADNRTEDGRKRNRRIEFRVIPARELPAEPRP